VQREILGSNRTANLRVYAVWVPFLGADQGAANLSERVLPDPRVVQFWDGGALTSEWFAKNVEHSSFPAWDVYYLYGSDAVWTSGLYLNDRTTMDVSLPARVRRSLAVSAVVAGSFTLLFGVMGALFSLAASPIVRSLPWAGFGVGVVLIHAGGVILAGKPVGTTISQQVAGRVGRHASRSGIRGYAAFGLAYGLASLGCALPLFLALLGTAVAAGGPWTAAEAFVRYGAGMATTLGLLTLADALVSFGVLARVRGVGRFVSGLGSVLLLASGTYVVYYWLTAGRVLLT
jgi:cytochrome c-type biogenesis protein